MTAESTSTLYDQIIYGDEPFASTHPQRLGAIGAIFGMTPAPTERARVLELGTARGMNLLGMAYAYPEASFVGIDLSIKQVELGRELIRELGLQNLELIHMNLLDVTADLGHFDYIISHGTLSWVPPAVASKMFQICGELLTQQGIAYLSYNTNPGWKSRHIFREMMLFECADEPNLDLRVRKARGALEMISRVLEDNTSSAAAYLKQELPQFKSKPDWYFHHDFIADFNRPYYVSEVIKEAATVGLQYLGDSELPTMVTHGVTPSAQTWLRKIRGDIMRFEQYSDIARNRMFRRSLFCRQEIELDRRVAEHQLSNLYVATRMTSEPIEGKPHLRRLCHPSGGAIESSDPILQESYAALSEIWPKAITLQELTGILSNKGLSIDRLTPISAGLLQGIFADLVDVRLSAGPAACTLPDRPVASSFARMQSLSSERVVNLLHQVISLEDFDREVLALVDGENTDYDMMTKLFPDQELGETEINRVAKSLETLVRSALIHT